MGGWGGMEKSLGNSVVCGSRGILEPAWAWSAKSQFPVLPRSSVAK